MLALLYCGTTEEESLASVDRGGVSHGVHAVHAVRGRALLAGAHYVHEVKESVVSLARSCECMEAGAQDRVRLDPHDNYSKVAMIAELEDPRKVTFSSPFASSELIYNLSDVEKFLPEIDEETAHRRVEMATRKRKERQDSGSSSVQERKVIRSNSEERTAETKPPSDDNIRRVSSHEDFEKCKKPVARTPAVPLHEQNCADSPPPAKSPAPIAGDYDAAYLKDDNISSDIGEKYSNIFGPNMESDNSSSDYYCVRQKYSKNDSSPSRSRIHEYVLFPKRISPNRDPKASSGSGISFRGAPSEAERDHESLRCSERRSRTPAPRGRRPPTRKQVKNKQANGQEFHKSSSKENDSTRTSAEKTHSFGLHKDIVTPHISKRNDSITVGDKVCKGEVSSSAQLKSGNREHGHWPFSSREHLEHLVNYCESESGKKKDHSFSGSMIGYRPERAIYSRSRSQSPIHKSVSPIKKTPHLDLTTLHEQLGQNEPVPSVPIKFIGFPWDPETSQDLEGYNIEPEPIRDDNIVGYNKEMCDIRSQRRTLPDKCDNGIVEISGGYAVMEPDERLNKIAKKLVTLKKRIVKYESEFELSHGYKSSHADKMNDHNLCKLYAEVRKLKNERKSIKAGPGESIARLVASDSSSGDNSLKKKPMSEIMVEIERRLEAKREIHERPSRLEACSRIQLSEEKAAVQRALLWLEGARGRPTAKADRDAARPLYDRYRAVKRLVARMDAMKLNTSAGELATIMEHETMLFTNLESPCESSSPGEAVEKPSFPDTATSFADSPSDKKEIEDAASSSAKSTASDETNALIEESEMVNENLHCMSLKELNKLHSETKALKSSLRASIKAFEADFEVQNSRKMLKDERQGIMPTYAKYKETKARLRLLTALVNKQKKSYG